MENDDDFEDDRNGPEDSKDLNMVFNYDNTLVKGKGSNKTSFSKKSKLKIKDNFNNIGEKIPKDNKYTGGWQPICYYFKVGLTPKAKEKANNLLKFLQDMRNLHYSQGRFEKGNGTSINEQELQIAIDYDIIETERKFLFFKEPVGISNKYKTVQRYLNSKDK